MKLKWNTKIFGNVERNLCEHCYIAEDRQYIGGKAVSGKSYTTGDHYEIPDYLPNYGFKICKLF